MRMLNNTEIIFTNMISIFPCTVGTSPTMQVQTNYQTLHGKTGSVHEYNNYHYYPEILYYHIDNPNNDPIVIHFLRFNYRVSTYVNFTSLDTVAALF